MNPVSWWFRARRNDTEPVFFVCLYAEGICNMTMDSNSMTMPMSDPNAWATAMNNLGMPPIGMTGQQLMPGTTLLNPQAQTPLCWKFISAKDTHCCTVVSYLTVIGIYLQESFHQNVLRPEMWRLEFILLEGHLADYRYNMPNVGCPMPRIILYLYY